MKILGLGNALVDMLIRMNDDRLLDELNLQKGSMQLVDEHFKDLVLSRTVQLEKAQASGGSAANTIHGLASMGIETSYIGKVGTDALGDFFSNDLLSNGIHPLLKTSTTSTGVASALISPDSERTFGTYLGAAVEVGAADIDASQFEGHHIFHLEGYLVLNQKLVLKALQLAKENGLLVSLDLASFNVVEANLGFLRKITHDSVDIVFANEEEAKAFTGKAPDEALDEIASMCNVAVVKVGKNGSLVKRGNEKVAVPAIPANVIDTTGAGDLYAAGFLYGLAKEFTLEKCAKSGALLAGKVIEVIGAKIPAETWPEIKKQIQAF